MPHPRCCHLRTRPNLEDRRRRSRSRGRSSAGRGVAERDGRIKQLLRDRKLIAIRQPDGTLGVPAAFLDGHQIIKGLHGTLTLLFDCGFDEPEAVRWLFTADETLPGTPLQAIAEHRGTEVNRRAQALAF